MLPRAGENCYYWYIRVKKDFKMIMKKFLMLILPVIMGAAMVSGQAQIQVVPGKGIDVKKIEFQAQQTPIYQALGPKDKSFKPREWLEVEVEFEAKGVLPKDAVVPELLFRYYVAMIDKDNKPVVMSGDITHLNLQAGEETFSAVYVAPDTLGKITGNFDRFNVASVYAVGVEIYYNGVLVGGGIEGKTNKKFWEGKSPQAGVLSRGETPYNLLWIDRYAEEKPKK